VILKFHMPGKNEQNILDEQQRKKVVLEYQSHGWRVRKVEGPEKIRSKEIRRRASPGKEDQLENNYSRTKENESTPNLGRGEWFDEKREGRGPKYTWDPYRRSKKRSIMRDGVHLDKGVGFP